MSSVIPSYEWATFIRFQDNDSQTTRRLLRDLTRWNPEPGEIVDPGDRGKRALNSAVGGDWMHPSKVMDLTIYLRLRRDHYDRQVHDLSLPGWARQEWRSAVQEHDEAIDHLRGLCTTGRSELGLQRAQTPRTHKDSGR